jgi:hypothetical protein
MSGPPFINSTDMQQGLPPFKFTGVDIRNFALRADPDALDAWCDTFMNVSPRYRFRPLAPVVTLGINRYATMTTLFPGYENLGFTRQNEYYLMFPVVRETRLFGLWMPTEMSWVYPYIGVDNASSAFTGQEVLGFRKMLGTIGFEDRSDGTFASEVAMPGFATLGPTAEQEMLPIVRIETGPRLTTPPALPRGFPWSHFHLPEIASGLDDALLWMLEALDPGFFSVTNLKQFRDGADPMRAVYQALVRSSYRQSNVSPPFVYAGATIEVIDNETIRAVETLGLGAGGGLDPLLSMGFSTDMWFGDVETLWAAS